MPVIVGKAGADEDHRRSERLGEEVRRSAARVPHAPGEREAVPALERAFERVPSGSRRADVRLLRDDLVSLERVPDVSGDDLGDELAQLVGDGVNALTGYRADAEGGLRRLGDHRALQAERVAGEQREDLDRRPGPQSLEERVALLAVDRGGLDPRHPLVLVGRKVCEVRATLGCELVDVVVEAGQSDAPVIVVQRADDIGDDVGRVHRHPHTSMRPNAATAVAARACTAASSVTSVGTTRASPPAARHSSATTSRALALRDARTSRAPRRAWRCAVARPMPLDAPVMTTTGGFLFRAARMRRR